MVDRDRRVVITKFGGTSVGTAEGREALVARVTELLEADASPVVVVSAMGRSGDPYATDSPALLEAFRYLRKAGTLVSIGTYFHSMSFVPVELLVDEYVVVNSYGYTSGNVTDLTRVLASVQTGLGGLIEEIPLSAVVEHGYYRAEVDKDSFTRLVIAC